MAQRGGGTREFYLTLAGPNGARRGCASLKRGPKFIDTAPIPS